MRAVTQKDEQTLLLQPSKMPSEQRENLITRVPLFVHLTRFSNGASTARL